MDRWDPDAELPIKLGPCSNGEFRRFPLGPVEREAIRRTRDEAEHHARRLGVGRRARMSPSVRIAERVRSRQRRRRELA